MAKKPDKSGENQGAVRNKKGQFVKGVSGNPEGGGRPLGSVSLITIMKQRLAEGGKAEEIVDATIRDALAGDQAARKLVWDRIEGPIATQITGPDGEALAPCVIILPSNGSE